MTEPRRGYEVLLRIVELGERYPRLGNFYPIGADVFVFVYPIFLTALYLYGIRKKDLQSKKKLCLSFLPVSSL